MHGLHHHESRSLLSPITVPLPPITHHTTLLTIQTHDVNSDVRTRASDDVASCNDAATSSDTHISLDTVCRLDVPGAFIPLVGGTRLNI